MKLPSFLTVSLVLVASAMAKEEAASDLVGPARASLQRGASRKSSNRRMSPDFDNGEIDSKRVLKAGKGGKGNPCKNARNTLMSINNECLLLSAEIQSIGTVVTDYCTLLDDIADSTPPTIDPLTEVAPLETTGKGKGKGNMPPINTYESQIDAFCDVLLSQAQDVDAQLSIISSIQEAVAAIPLLAQAYAQLLLLCPLSNPVPPATACILPAEAASVPPVGTLPVCP